MNCEQRLIEEYWVSFEQESSKKSIAAAFGICDAIKISLIIIFVAFSLLVKFVGVDGESMEPTLKNGDILCISSGISSPKRGDIVVISQPWEKNIPIIKRIIGIEGDEIDIDFASGEVFVNSEKLNESYINSKTNLEYDLSFPLTVEKGKVFVMGDNRNDSLDSRSSQIGQIDENYILGKVYFKLFNLG